MAPYYRLIFAAAYGRGRRLEDCPAQGQLCQLQSLVHSVSSSLVNRLSEQCALKGLGKLHAREHLDPSGQQKPLCTTIGRFLLMWDGGQKCVAHAAQDSKAWMLGSNTEVCIVCYEKPSERFNIAI